jgi:hypothetical protein
MLEWRVVIRYGDSVPDDRSVPILAPKWMRGTVFDARFDTETEAREFAEQYGGVAYLKDWGHNAATP